jgi:Ca-activated chloride channel family protein
LLFITVAALALSLYDHVKVWARQSAEAPPDGGLALQMSWLPVLRNGLLLLLAAAATLAFQRPPFRADTQLVAVYATVIDKHRQLVPNFLAEDFELLDNGIPQPVEFFGNTRQPIAAVLLLDTSAQTTLSFERVRDAAEQFVLRLPPEDQARICAFNDRIQCSGAFTNDRDSLARDVRDIDFGKGSRLYDALAAALDALKTAERRRVILVFSDGNDTASRTKLRTVRDHAQAEDVVVYAVGLPGRRFTGETFVDDEPDYGLERLAKDTGGAYFDLDHVTDLNTRLARVGDELHSPYLLGFAPAVADGRVHRLTVRLKNRHLSVRARRSYVAASRSTRD